MVPSPRSFAPKSQLEEALKRVQGSNYNGKKNKFVDRYAEANANNIVHTLEKPTTVYRNAEWMITLRSDRQERASRNKRVGKASRSPM